MRSWLRSSRKICLGHRLYQPHLKLFDPPYLRFYTAFGSKQGQPEPENPTQHAHRITCPLPPRELRENPAEWIPYLERYIPREPQSDAEVFSTEWEVEQTEQDQCKSILQLLYQARAQWNLDLLTFLGFDLGRWQDFHSLINKLLDNADSLRFPLPKGQLPSNIDWNSMGSFKEITHNKLYSIETIPINRGKNDIPLSSFDSYSPEPLVVGRMGESATRTGTMEEIWQCLGFFIIRAASLPSDGAASLTPHFYRIVARLHSLDMIPHDVYKYTPNRDKTVPNRPPGMNILSHAIMNILSESAWEANATATDSKVKSNMLSYRSRELGLGLWLEFVLWCCVEGGYSREAAWILQQWRHSKEEWNVRSWDKLVKGNGPVDVKKMTLYDNWAQCGSRSDDPLENQLGKPFLGMGARTITREVVVAIIDGLSNSLKVGVGFRGDSPHFVWERIGMLRTILNKNGLSLRPGHVSYLVVRILEASSIVPETKPQTLELLLNLAPYITTSENLRASLQVSLDGRQREYKPDYSGIVLGLYQYVLNIYAANGHISGALDVFLRLLGSVDSEEAQNIFKLVLDHRYLIKPQTIRRKKANFHPDLNRLLNTNNSPSTVQLSPVSWSLVIDVLTSSRAYRLMNWFLTNDTKESINLPKKLYNDDLVAPALIRFAAATGNQDLFSSVTKELAPPLSHSILTSLLDYRAMEFDWQKASQLLLYLRDLNHGQWDVTNVATLAAAIIKLEHQLYRRSDSIDDYTQAVQEQLSLARAVITKLFEGRFNRIFDSAFDRLQTEEILVQLHRLFSSIPGTLSQVCRDVEPPSKRSTYIMPAKAFNQILASVVETQGSSAGKKLWHRFCVDPGTVGAQRIQTGGNQLLYFSNEIDSRTGGVRPFFDFNAVEKRYGKLTTPNLITVRIIAQAALSEQRFLWQNRTFSPHSMHLPSEAGVESTLDWCAKMFRRFHLGGREIDRELDGHWTRSSMPTLALTVSNQKPTADQHQPDAETVSHTPNPPESSDTLSTSAPGSVA